MAEVAPTSPVDCIRAIEDVIEDSQEHCDENPHYDDIDELRRMESEELGEVLEAVSYYLNGRHTNSGLTGRNDLWGFSGIKGEESRVETAKTLKLVSKCFRLALKKNVIRLNARLKGYKNHEAMLAGKYALAERVWKEDPYHHDY